MSGAGRCSLCGAQPVTMLSKVPDYVTGEDFSVVRCPACGLAATQPAPADLSRYYPVAYRRFSPIVHLALGTLYRLRVRSWIRRFGSSGRALEVGSGNGWMLKVLQDNGWSVTGVERSYEVAAHIRLTQAVPMMVGMLEALREEPTFDLIVMFQVLEHMNDPMAVLTECAARLKPGGSLIVAVPNLDSWQARATGASWQHLDVPRHLFHFAPETLTRAVESVGLKAGSISFVSWEHDPFGWVQSVLNRLGFRQNQLIRWLQREERDQLASPAGVAVLAIAVVISLPAMLLALVSWACGQGALMELSAVKPREP